MGGEGYARDRAESSNSALWGAQVRSKAIRARSEMPRRWPSETGGTSTGMLLGSMRGSASARSVGQTQARRYGRPSNYQLPCPDARMRCWDEMSSNKPQRLGWAVDISLRYTMSEATRANKMLSEGIQCIDDQVIK